MRLIRLSLSRQGISFAAGLLLGLFAETSASLFFAAFDQILY